MTIPRQLGPETGPRTALPDYSRSSATVERMVSELQRGSEHQRTSAAVRALFPAAATRDTALRAVVSALLLGGAVIAAVAIGLLLVTLEEGRSP